MIIEEGSWTLLRNKYWRFKGINKAYQEKNGEKEIYCWKYDYLNKRIITLEGANLNKTLIRSKEGGFKKIEKNFWENFIFAYVNFNESNSEEISLKDVHFYQGSMKNVGLKNTILERTHFSGVAGITPDSLCLAKGLESVIAFPGASDWFAIRAAKKVKKKDQIYISA